MGCNLNSIVPAEVEFAAAQQLLCKHGGDTRFDKSIKTWFTAADRNLFRADASRSLRSLLSCSFTDVLAALANDGMSILILVAVIKRACRDLAEVSDIIQLEAAPTGPPAPTADTPSAVAPTPSQPGQPPSPHQGQSGVFGVEDRGDLGIGSAELIDIAQLQADPAEDDGDFEIASADAPDEPPLPAPVASQRGTTAAQETAGDQLATRALGRTGKATDNAGRGIGGEEAGAGRAIDSTRKALGRTEKAIDNAGRGIGGEEAGAGRAIDSTRKCLAEQERRLTTQADELAAKKWEQEERLAAEAKRLTAWENRLGEKRLAATTLENKSAEARERLALEERQRERERAERLATQKQRQHEEELERQCEAQGHWEERKRRWEEQKREALRWGEERSRTALVALVSVTRLLLRRGDKVLRRLTRHRRDARVRRVLVPARRWGRKADQALRGWSSRLATFNEAGMRRCLWLVSALVLILVLVAGALVMSGGGEKRPEPIRGQEKQDRAIQPTAAAPAGSHRKALTKAQEEQIRLRLQGRIGGVGTIFLIQGVLGRQNGSAPFSVPRLISASAPLSRPLCCRSVGRPLPSGPAAARARSACPGLPGPSGSIGGRFPRRSRCG